MLALKRSTKDSLAKRSFKKLVRKQLKHRRQDTQMWHQWEAIMLSHNHLMWLALRTAIWPIKERRRCNQLKACVCRHLRLSIKMSRFLTLPRVDSSIMIDLRVAIFLLRLVSSLSIQDSAQVSWPCIPHRMLWVQIKCLRSNLRDRCLKLNLV